LEILGFISALVGLVAAIVNRKRIIVLRYEYGSAGSSQTGGGPVTVRKRFKRFLLAIGAAMVFPCIAGAAGASGDADEILMWPFGFFLLVAAYQLVAIFILILIKLWR